MDFKLYFAVLKRYKRIVIGGMVLAVVLSVLSYGTPGFKGGKPTVIPRGSEIWEGDAEILISQEGFPYGRAVQQVAPGKAPGIPAQTIGDYNYMASLSSVYAAVANGNYVQRQIGAEARVPLCPLLLHVTQPCGTVVATEVADLNTGAPLPLITLTASAPTAADAAKLATTAVTVLQSQITRQQAAASTPVDQRIELQAVKSGTPATLTKGPSKSIPILVLFAIVSASIALAFIRNNHSDHPIRSTRRRLDEGLGSDGGPEFAHNGNGRVTEPSVGAAQSGAERMQLLGLRPAESATRLAEAEDAAPPRSAPQEPSATDRHWSRSDRRSPHLLHGSGFEPEPRD
jgi:hypothetical protein